MSELKQLGKPVKEFLGLETFDVEHDVDVRFHCTEFTCRCPVTGQPDWAQITFSFTTNGKAVESKSVKLWLETFRDTGIFHERLAAVLGRKLVAVLEPKALTLTVHFNTRGGIAIEAQYNYDPQRTSFEDMMDSFTKMEQIRHDLERFAEEGEDDVTYRLH